MLRGQSFRVHHCHKAERRAREVVKVTKRNSSSRPVLRKFTARLDDQDYGIDFNNETIRIAVLNNEYNVMNNGKLAHCDISFYISVAF